MEHPFFPTTTTRAEALRWLTISEKLLSKRDLMGSKSFASRARDSDPTLTPADQILAVADTLLAGDSRIGNNLQDWYAILHLTPQQGRDAEFIAAQYRNLALLLNPQKNRFPFADQAFRLVIDAWSVLSNPSRKSQYDKELAFYLNPQQQQQQQPDPFPNPIPPVHQNFIFFGGSSSGGVTQSSQSQGGAPFSQVQVHANPQVDPVGGGSTREAQNFMNFTSGSNLVFGSGSKLSQDAVNKQTHDNYPTFPGNVTNPPGFSPEQLNNKNQQAQQHYSNLNANVDNEEDMDRTDVQEERIDPPEDDDGSTIWTACPYCYYMYEYPEIYADCTLRCQNCKKAFQAVVIPSPPPVVDGQNGYFCCWGFLPLGFSMENWEKNKSAAPSWTPFSPMFTCPQGLNSNSARKKGPRKSSGPRVYIDDDDEVFLEISEPSGSDDDWGKRKDKRKKKTKNLKGKGASASTPNKSAKKAQIDNKGTNVNAQDGIVSPDVVEKTPNKVAPTGELSKKGANVNARKQPGRVAKNFGKLDLNVEFSNSEAEEPGQVAPAQRTNQGNGPSRGEDDNIEGIGFFEGLDEFLSSLPILNVVGDDKVVKAA